MELNHLINIIKNTAKELEIDPDDYTVAECQELLKISIIKESLDQYFNELEQKEISIKEDFYLQIIELYQKESKSKMIPEPINLEALGLYLQEIKKYSIPTKEEELALLIRIKQGDKIARDELITRNQRLIISMAKKYAYNFDMILPLIQEGNIGIIKAIQHFSLEKKTKFATYAIFWIKREILHYLRKNYYSMTLPSELENVYIKMKRYINQYKLLNGKEPSNEQLSREFDLPISEIKNIKLAKEFPQSLNVTINDDEMEWGDTFVDKNNSSLDEDTITKIQRQEFLKEMDLYLTEREKNVVLRYFGFNKENHPNTYNQISKELKITPETARQIVTKSLRKLKYKSSLIKSYKNL